jgi:hypothetical protein
MYSVYFKNDFATRGASACAARAIPFFVTRHSSFCGSLFNPGHRNGQSNHHETVPFWGSFIRARPLAKKTASLIKKET